MDTAAIERAQLAVLSAGGTIFGELTQQGIKPITSSRESLERYGPKLLEQYNPLVEDLFKLDSTNMHYPEYLQIAKVSQKKVQEGYRAVSVAQGTDSMTYGNGFLTVRFPFKNFHLGIVGSMKELSSGPGSDAHRNLEAAFIVGHEGWPGTYNFVNNGEVLRAPRSVETRPNKIVTVNGEERVVSEKKAFESVNYPVLAHLRGSNGNRRIEFVQGSEPVQAQFLLRQKEKYEYFRSLEEYYGSPVFLWHYSPVYVAELHPNFDPGEFDRAFRDYKVIVIKAPGTGGIFTTPKEKALLPRIKKHIERGGFVAIASRVPQAVVDTSYEVNREGIEAGAVLMADAHSELVMAKAEVGGALADTPQEFQAFMYFPIEDDIRPGLLLPENRTSDDAMLSLLRSKRNKR